MTKNKAKSNTKYNTSQKVTNKSVIKNGGNLNEHISANAPP